MTTRTKRLANVSIGRVTDDGSDVGTAPLGDNIYGKVNNIAGGAHVQRHNENWGPIGPVQEANETHAITDLTFDLLDCSEQPESLGPVDIYLNIYRSWRDDAGALVTNVKQFVGRFETEDGGTWDRDTDNPRPMVFKSYRLIMGGGAALNDLAKANSAFYLDTQTGEYLTREGGTGPQVDHFAAMRTAHGL